MPQQHALRTKVEQISISRRRRTSSGWNVLEEWEQAGRRGEKFIAFFIVDILMLSKALWTAQGNRMRNLTGTHGQLHLPAFHPCLP